MQTSYFVSNLPELYDLDNGVLASLIAGLGVQTAEQAEAIKNGEQFVVVTDAGTLTGRMYVGTRNKERPRSHTPAWVHFRFFDINAAEVNPYIALGIRLNRHSGKWNWMFSGVKQDNTRTLSALHLSLCNLNPRNFAIIK